MEDQDFLSNGQQAAPVTQNLVYLLENTKVESIIGMDI
jgi:hypothetical protein